MSLINKALSFSKLVENTKSIVLSASISLAEKFEAQLLSQAQENATNAFRTRVLKLVTDHLKSMPNMELGQAVEPFWQDMTDDQAALSAAKKVYSVAMKTDKNLANAIYGQMEAFQKYVNDNQAKLDEVPAPQAETALNQESVQTTKSPTSKSKYPSIDKHVQEQLRYALADTKFALLDADGILGPQTQQALNLFKQKYNLPVSTDNKTLFSRLAEVAAKNQTV